MSENKNTGLSFTAALLLIFVVLKLTGLIAWSWWWVFSPIWAPLAIVLVLIPPFIVYEKKNKNQPKP